jgi:hypothetical protein
MLTAAAQISTFRQAGSALILAQSAMLGSQ